MRKTAGFTLIELVIVIVILGILGAVAAPKFINLQGDAYGANVKTMAGSLQSAAVLSNTKAILEGKDGATHGTVDVTGYTGVDFVFGFPIAAENNTGILGALQTVPSTDDYAIEISETDPVELTLQPKSRAGADKAAILAATKCFVRYTAAADKNTPAKVIYDNDCD